MANMWTAAPGRAGLLVARTPGSPASENIAPTLAPRRLSGSSGASPRLTGWEPGSLPPARPPRLIHRAKPARPARDPNPEAFCRRHSGRFFLNAPGCTTLALCSLALVLRSQSPELAIYPGQAVLEPPTVICLGVHWPYTGDDNENATARIRFRRAGAGDAAWTEGLPLWRIRPAHVPDLPAGSVARAFAGSLFDLAPDTAYEVEVSVNDPDGGSVTQTLQARTRPVPQAPAGLREVRVAPGQLAAALAASRPGDLLLLEPGIHRGATFYLRKQADPAHPIVVRGVARDEVILEGTGSGTLLDVSGSSHVFLEDLTLRGAREGIRCHQATGLVIRRCRLIGLEEAIRCTVGPARDFYIADNLLEGPSTWPAPPGVIEAREGIQVLGTGHVVCHNRIARFGDGLSVAGRPAVAIDFYGNEIEEATDDGIELDYSERNTRCFRNRITNTRVGISLQPVYGGPCYVWRNEILNTQYTPFKLHNAPSGGLLLHNTAVRPGVALVVWSGVPVKDFLFRNNLFVGTASQVADWTSEAINCDLDYDGYSPGSGVFKIGNVRYASLSAAARAGVEVHGRVVPWPVFEAAVQIPADPAQKMSVAPLDLRVNSRALDAGLRLPNLNDHYQGAAPDLGARERGAAPPVYGPRPAGVDESGASPPTRLQAAGFAAPGGPFRFALMGQPGWEYAVQASPDLVVWTPLTNVGGGVAWVIEDPAAPGWERRFYRAKAVP